jgi:sterol desaturase/sphingolipid hydroxylase (fatty acid hydroxylase superfamily)
MRLSKAGYYADYVVYPVLLVPLAAVAVVERDPGARIIWGAVFCCGVIVFTLLEYLTHRLLLHRVPPFSDMHDVHHRHPTADIGIPVWMSAAAGGTVFAALWLGPGLNIASGITAGLVVGYLWFGVLHHAVHRWRARDGSYLHRAKRRHSRHHNETRPCNFGVTTPYWDRVFGTAQ